MIDGYTPLVPIDTFSVGEIFSVHYFEYSSDYAYPGETHDFWEFCYVDKGEVQVTDGRRKLTLGRSQIIFHPPGRFHSLQANGRVAPNLVVASFGCNSPAMQWFTGRVLPVGDAERGLLARMIDEASDAFLSPLNDPELKTLERSVSAAPGAEQMVRLCLEALLVTLYRGGLQPAPHTAAPTTSITGAARQHMLDKVVAYMQENIDKKLTLEDLCTANLVGRSHLQKLFRDKTGGGAMEYFGRLKIEQAKRMIREGEHNFTEIAAALGYNSIHYFSRHFKKVAGSTPSEYAGSVRALTARSRME